MIKISQFNHLIHINRYVGLIMVLLLVLGVFHQSFEHDELVTNTIHLEQECEFCLSHGATPSLASSSYTTDFLSCSNLFENRTCFFYQPVHPFGTFHPRAPPVS